MLEPLLRLVAPFAQDPDSGVVLDHAGGGRFVNYDPTLVQTPDWLADAGYGPRIPRQILKMEEAKQRAPGAKMDISWNDNGIQFTTNPDLRHGLIRFMQRHPDTVLLGTDTVKPVTRSQYLQNLTTLTDFFIELAAVDRDLALNALRGNFETMADRAVGKTMDAPTLRGMADKLDEFAAQIEAPTNEPMRLLVQQLGGYKAETARGLRGHAQTLRDKADELGSGTLPGRDTANLVRDGVIVNGPDGRPMTIVTGRNQMRETAEQIYGGIEFEWIASNFGTDNVRNLMGALPRENDPVGGEDGVHAHDGSNLIYIDGQEIEVDQQYNLGPVPGRMRDYLHPQVGTGAGAPWADQAPARRMVWADSAAVTAAGILGLVPGVGIAAGLGRVSLFGRGQYRQEFARRLWESIFEDGRSQGISLFTHETVDVGRRMDFSDKRLREFVDAMMQMEVDVNYVYQQTAEWAGLNNPDALQHRGWNEGDLTLASHVRMGVIGIGQISGDRALGVQASSLLHLDPRTSKGRRHNLYIATSSSASAVGSWSTTAATVAVMPPGTAQIVALATGSLFSTAVSVTQAFMIWQRLWQNRFGRGNINPELNDRFRRLQERILAGIEATGGTGAANAVVVGFAGNGSLIFTIGNVVLDLGVVAAADIARRNERARVNLEGAIDPGPNANRIRTVLLSLAGETAATGASLSTEAFQQWFDVVQESPEAMAEIIDAINKGLDGINW